MPRQTRYKPYGRLGLVTFPPAPSNPFTADQGQWPRDRDWKVAETDVPARCPARLVGAPLRGRGVARCRGKRPAQKTHQWTRYESPGPFVLEGAVLGAYPAASEGRRPAGKRLGGGRGGKRTVRHFSRRARILGGERLKRSEKPAAFGGKVYLRHGHPFARATRVTPKVTPLRAAVRWLGGYVIVCKHICRLLPQDGYGTVFSGHLFQNSFSPALGEGPRRIPFNLRRWNA